MAFSISPSTQDNSLFIEEAPTNVTSCSHCTYLIELGDLRVTFYRSQRTSVYYHLSCFTPFTRLRIDERDLDSGVIREKSKENQERLRDWLAQWNKQFLLSKHDLDSITRKSIATSPPPTRRVLLEAFKFLNPVCLGASVSLVCKAWYHVSWEEELWQVVGLPAHSKEKYLQHLLTTCIHCQEVLAPEARFMVCPLLRRPKCRRCYSKKKYRPFRVQWARSAYKLTRDYLVKVGATLFEFDGQECCYLHQVKKLVDSHRKKIVSMLFEMDKEGVLAGCRDVLNLSLMSNSWNLRFRRYFDRKVQEHSLASRVQAFVQKAKTRSQCAKFLQSLRTPQQSSA